MLVGHSVLEVPLVCRSAAVGPGGCSSGRAPGSTPVPKKSNSKSIASVLRCSLTQKLKGRLQTAALPPPGTAEKPDPEVSRGLLTTKDIPEMLQTPSPSRASEKYALYPLLQVCCAPVCS